MSITMFALMFAVAGLLAGTLNAACYVVITNINDDKIASMFLSEYRNCNIVINLLHISF